MKLIEINSYLNLREELNEFVTLCNRYNYTPSKDEFDDAIRFILLHHGGGASHLCESYELNPFKLMNHLYESFDFNENNHKDFLIEASTGNSTYDPEADYDSAVGTATTGAKMAAKGAGVAAGVAAGAAVGAIVGIGTLIAYLWKRGKVKGAITKERDAEMAKLDGYVKLAEMKKKLASIDPTASKTLSFPGVTPGKADDSGSSGDVEDKPEKTDPKKEVTKKDDTGSNDDAGSTGASGPTGDAGSTGASGDAGSTGASGASGPTGDSGSTGASGPTGDSGDSESKGASGPTGDTGATAEKGATGATAEKIKK